MRGAALVTLAVGAAGSLVFTLQTGRHNKSILLMTLFAVWVLSPFAMLAGVTIRANVGPFFKSILLMTVVSLAVYGRVAFGPPIARPASFFLLVPAASWLLIAIVVMIRTRTDPRP